MIGPHTITKMKVMADAHIDNYATKMNEVFERSDDGKLRVTLAFDIAVSDKLKK